MGFIFYILTLVLYIVKPPAALVCFPIAYLLIARNQNIEKALLTGIILSLPLSYINIFGGDYGGSPLSWYNIFCGLFILHEIPKRGGARTGALISFLLLCSFILSAIFSYNLLISVKSLLTTGLTCLVLIAFWNSYKPEKYSKTDILVFGKQFIIMICSTALVMLAFRILWLRGIVFENSGIMDVGGGRVGNKFLFSDFSFLSVFLAMGAAYCFFFPFKKKWLQLALPLLLLIACIDTTARSGLAALLIFGAFFLVKKIILHRSIKYFYF